MAIIGFHHHYLVLILLIVCFLVYFRTRSSRYQNTILAVIKTCSLQSRTCPRLGQRLCKCIISLCLHYMLKHYWSKHEHTYTQTHMHWHGYYQNSTNPERTTNLLLTGHVFRLYQVHAPHWRVYIHEHKHTHTHQKKNTFSTNWSWSKRIFSQVVSSTDLSANKQQMQNNEKRHQELIKLIPTWQNLGKAGSCFLPHDRVVT